MRFLPVLLASLTLAACATVPSAASAQTLSSVQPISVQCKPAIEGGTVDCVVKREGTSTRRTASFGWTLEPATAKPGLDYVQRSGSNSIAKNASTYTIRIQTVEDAIYEAPETFTFRLTASTGSSVSQPTTTATIEDDDPKPATKWCAGGIEIPATETCETKTCPDGSVIQVALECPPVVVPPTKRVGAFEGDSTDIFWGGNWTGILAATRPDVEWKGFAVGGSGMVEIEARWPTVAATNPSIIVGTAGVNDLGNTSQNPTVTVWIDRVRSYVSRAKADGKKVAWGAVIGGCYAAATPEQIAAYEARRKAANEALRGMVGKEIDAFLPFDAVPNVSTKDGMCDPLNSSDGVHPHGQAYEAMAAAAKPYVDAVLDGKPLPPLPPAVTYEPAPHHDDDWRMNPTPTIFGTVPIPEADKLIDPKFHLKPSWYGGPAPKAADGGGAFRFICEAGQIAYADPLAKFGGRSHLHQFFGLMNVTPTDTFETMRTKEANSSCNHISDDDWAKGIRPLNKSAYWLSAMLDGTPVTPDNKTADGRQVMVVKPDYASNYYKRGSLAGPACNGQDVRYAHQKCVGLPDAFRMIVGFDMQAMKMRTNLQGWKPYYFDCDGPTGKGGHYNTFAEAKANCPYEPTKPMDQQNRIGIVTTFPTCWNGRDLDSPNHMDHVVHVELNNNYGAWMCPVAFPYVIPAITNGFWYTVDANLKDWILSSDVVAGMLPGESFHDDYFGGWHDKALTTVNVKCLDDGRDSSGGDMCDGTQLPGAQSNGSGRANPRLVPIPVG